MSAPTVATLPSQGLSGARLRLTLVWLLLMLLTVASVELGAHGTARQTLSGVLLLALLKGQFLVDHFMGLRRVHRVWRALMAAWLATVGALIAIAFLLA
ncbi:MAG: cytochrome C oxidase subunit IV family protein [Pseudomonadota bacterium]|nr:cytochrome C oxidase subunit IV family protein [Pseudomonadota bacterium]